MILGCNEKQNKIRFGRVTVTNKMTEIFILSPLAISVLVPRV